MAKLSLGGPSTIVSTAITEQARAELETLARAADRSLSAEVRRAITEHLVRERADEGEK